MSTNTLTERYVREVVRRIPADQREDVANELRTIIADMVEARESADPHAAEHEVLTEMGDPIQLAARYADRPMALIGPELYPTYLRLLKVLLTIVLPIVTIVLVVIDVVDNKDLGSVIGAGIGGLLTIGAQMIAWVTVVFALIDRTSYRDGRFRGAKTWSPDELPEIREVSQRSERGAVASAVWSALLIGLIVWQHTAAPYRADSNRLQVLDPALWSGWIWPILLGLAGIVVLELVRVAARGWTRVLATWYAAAEALFALPLVWILYRQMFFNPEFLAEVNGSWTTPDAFYNVVALIVLAISVSAVVTRFREVSDQHSGSPAPWIGRK